MQASGLVADTGAPGCNGGAPIPEQSDMAPSLFTDVNIFDGSGRAPFPGQVLVADNAIGAAAEAGEFIGSRRRGGA